MAVAPRARVRCRLHVLEAAVLAQQLHAPRLPRRTLAARGWRPYRGAFHFSRTVGGRQRPRMRARRGLPTWEEGSPPAVVSGAASTRTRDAPVGSGAAVSTAVVHSPVRLPSRGAAVSFTLARARPAHHAARCSQDSKPKVLCKQRGERGGGGGGGGRSHMRYSKACCSRLTRSPRSSEGTCARVPAPPTGAAIYGHARTDPAAAS